MPSLEDAAAAIARTVERCDGKRQQLICEQWQQELLQGFLRGELRMFYVSDRRPIHADSPGATVGALTTGAVTLRELNRWLAAIGTDVVVEERSLRPMIDVKKVTSADVDVREVAHRLADEWARAYNDRTGGGIPTDEKVAKGIVRDLNVRFTQNWSVGTLRRHVLKGWKFSVLAHSAQIARADTA